MNTEYAFTLTFQLAAHEADQDAVVERLGAAGLTDALVGLGMAGQLGLSFNRMASSAEAAMREALRELAEVLPEARLIEVSPDLVGLSDVAALLDQSRQNVRKLMTRHAGQFPLPVHAGSTALWHLAPVLAFLRTRQQAIPKALFEVAEAAMRVNLERYPLRYNPSDS